jgi:hypothetical protein
MTLINRERRRVFARADVEAMIKREGEGAESGIASGEEEPQ